MKKTYNIVLKVNQPLTHSEVQRIWTHIDYLCNHYSTDSFVKEFEGQYTIDIMTDIGPEVTDDVVSRELIEQVYSVVKDKVELMCFVQLSYYGNYQFHFALNTSKEKNDLFSLDFLADVEDAIEQLRESI